MITTAQAFAAGLGLGMFFALFKLPIPAPPTIAGVLGVVGVTAGYLIVRGLQ